MPSNKNFLISYFSSYLSAIYNLLIFLPYFFSVKSTILTLFSPWKQMIMIDSTRGLDFDILFKKLMDQIISRGIGFILRLFILSIYLIFQFSLLLATPVIILGSLPLLPLFFLKKTLSKSQEDIKKEIKAEFVKSHHQNPEYLVQTENWFEQVYKNYLKTNLWWKKEELFKNPPIARDWAVGYTPTLDLYSTDMTSPEYQQSILQNIIGRDKELILMQQALTTSNSANIFIVGEAGVGKHTVLECLSKKIYQGQAGSILNYKRLLKINMEKILSEFSDNSKRENFIEDLFREASISKSALIIIDNIDAYTTSIEGRLDLTNVIEKFCQKNSLQFIGVTSPFSYEKYVYPNTKLRELFTKIDIHEISTDEALIVLQNRAIEFEQRYNVTIYYETLLEAIDKSNFFISNIPFPEKALDLLDSTCVYVSAQKDKRLVLPEDIDTVLTEKTHIPTVLTKELKNKLLQLETLMINKILGQNEAIIELANSLRRSFLLIGKRKKPISTLMFLGPTGVGKTETAKVLADVFFGSSKYVVRFDMSAFQNKADIPKLIGSNELKEPGLLTTEIRKTPYGILLLDEIEKAHPDLLNIFLTIIDEGYFKDGNGENVDCKNMVVIATSNAGASFMLDLMKRSISKENKIDSNTVVEYLIDNHLFSPEFLNRFDGVICYQPINLDTAKLIAKHLVSILSKNVYEAYKVKIEISDEMISELVTKNYNETFGVRNIQRIVKQKIEDSVSKTILEDKVVKGGSIKID